MPGESQQQQQQQGRPYAVIVWVFIALAAAAFLYFLLPVESDQNEISLGRAIDDAKAGRIERIEVSGSRLRLSYVPVGGADATVRTARIDGNLDIAELLRAEGIAISSGPATADQPRVDVTYKSAGFGAGDAFAVVLTILPIIFIGFIAWLIFRQVRGVGTGAATGFGKSRARLVSGGHVTVTFADVAGVDEAKEELAEIVEFLKQPQKFTAVGARPPRGILLLGPPGTGKTLLARAVAGEAGVPFFSISGSEFVELYVGVGASRVRDLFDQAKKNAPCIVFLDEIDAVGRQRGAGLGGSHDEREQTLNQILVEMDGFERGVNVVVLAATNRPDILDPALVRPGRFDRKVVLDAPDVKGREAILRVHLRGKPLSPDVSAETLAKMTPGFTGADLANLVNEAAILTARRDKHLIGPEEFEEATDRVLAGPERKSRLMTPEERRLMAYHEAGHVTVAHFLEHHDRPQKVTIVSRGVAGGYTRFIPEEESHFRTPRMFEDEICAALGGHAAEIVVFGEASTGPSNDLERVSALARAMVTRWGMSDLLGPLTFGRREELVFLGREISETRNYSERTAELIDAEVRRIVDEAHARAIRILEEHRPLLDRLASALLELETLQGDDLNRILDEYPRGAVTGEDANAAGG